MDEPCRAFLHGEGRGTFEARLIVDMTRREESGRIWRWKLGAMAGQNENMATAEEMRIRRHERLAAPQGRHFLDTSFGLGHIHPRQAD